MPLDTGHDVYIRVDAPLDVYDGSLPLLGCGVRALDRGLHEYEKASR